jgi:hypothetical protein
MSRGDKNLQGKRYRVSAKIVQQDVHDRKRTGRPDMWDPGACVWKHELEEVLLSA